MVARGEVFIRRISRVQKNSPNMKSRMNDKKLNLSPKSFLGQSFCLLCLAAAQKIAHAAHSLSLLGELHVKAGYVSTLLAG